MNNTGVGTSSNIQGSVTGASNTGYAGYFNNASLTGYGVYSTAGLNYFGGNVNIASGNAYAINNVNVLWYDTDTTSIGVGENAMPFPVASSYNTAVGDNALGSEGGASADVTAIGYEAAYTDASASSLTAIGWKALYNVTAGPNDAFGYKAGFEITSGLYNVVFGYEGLYGGGSNALTGNDNTSVGYEALNVAKTGAADNTAIGYEVLASYTTGTESTAVGYKALYNATGSPNDALGSGAGLKITSGTNNVAIGYNTMEGGTAITGANSTAVGNSALVSLAGAGDNDTAAGADALDSDGSGSNNTGVGYGAAFEDVSGNNITAVGYDAVYAATAGVNDAFGYEAGYTFAGSSDNVSIGYLALGNGAATTIPGKATAVGYQALYGFANSSAAGTNENTAIGYQAGYAGTAITTGNTDTFVGYQAQSNGATYVNGTAIGNGAILTASNVIVLGNTSIGYIYCEVTGFSSLSDRRFKKGITDLPSSLGLDFVEKLKPVSYRFKNGDETERYGFIAQDLEEALPTPLKNTVETAQPEHGLALLMRQNDKDRTYRLGYGELIAPIVKAIQQNEKQIESDHAEITRRNNVRDAVLGAQIEELDKRLDAALHQLFIMVAVAGISSLLIGFQVGRRKGRGTKN
jgi:hypothetical protein